MSLELTNPSHQEEKFKGLGHLCFPYSLSSKSKFVECWLIYWNIFSEGDRREDGNMKNGNFAMG